MGVPAPPGAATGELLNGATADFSAFGWGAALQPRPVTRTGKAATSAPSAALVQHARSAHYKFGDTQRVVVPNRLVGVGRVDVLSGPVTGTISEFLSEVRLAGDATWLVVTGIYVRNPLSPHGHRILLVVANLASTPPTATTVCASKLFGIRQRESAASLPPDAVRAVEIEEQKLFEEQAAASAHATSPDPGVVRRPLQRSHRRRRAAEPSANPKQTAPAPPARNTPSTGRTHQQHRTPAAAEITSLRHQLHDLQAEIRKLKVPRAPAAKPVLARVVRPNAHTHSQVCC